MAKLPDFPRVQPSQPVSNKVKGGVLAAILGISITGAVSTMGDVQTHESGSRRPLVAYLDSVKVPTICDGIIRYPDGRAVKMGDRATEAQCDSYFENEIANHARPLIRCIPQLYGRENQARALVDVSYNAGAAGICSGKIGTSIRAGNWSAAKEAIGAWKRGSFPRIPPNKVAYGCVANGGRYLCTIRGLENRRRENQSRFAVNMPAQGVR